MNFSLNEKTLELNISAEILEICRRYDRKVFMFGTRQAHFKKAKISCFLDEIAKDETNKISIFRGS